VSKVGKNKNLAKTKKGNGAIVEKVQRCNSKKKSE
jgi:hypothetical protein